MRNAAVEIKISLTSLCIGKNATFADAAHVAAHINFY
jgi:hypothetical protein